MIRLLWVLIVGRWPKKPLPPPTCSEEACCQAPPSPLCWDGRCRAHCAVIYRCRCEERGSGITRDEAALIAELRASTKRLSA